MPKPKHTSKSPPSELPEVAELFARISKILPSAIGFDEVIFRSVGVRYANEDDFLSGSGAATVGGRWNRKGIGAVYASLDVITATYEAYQNIFDAGFSSPTIRPRVMAGARARLRFVCDLTDPSIRRKIGFSLKELVEEDWQLVQESGEESWTQAIGRGCCIAGFEGLLVPSARHRAGKNIVIFPDRLRPDSTLTLISPKEFPPHPDDWPP